MPSIKMPALNSINSTQKRVLFAVSAVLLIGLLFYLQFSGRNNVDEPYGTYYDPGSGETVSNPKGKSDEYLGAQDNLPTYLGFSRLLDIGISQGQLDGLKVAFSKYPGINDSGNLHEVSISVDTIESAPHDIEDPNFIATFDVLINRHKTMFATIEYRDLSTIRLILRDKVGAKVQFDSGEINSKTVDDLDFTGD